MPEQISPSLPRTCFRRVFFLLVLLTIGPATVSVFQAVQAYHPSWRPLGTFAWGMDSVGLVLAIWLVTRAGVWRTWSGRLRAVVYVIAYAYGRMLFSATQDWWVNTDVPFRWPGADRQDYARPALDLLSLLMFAWMMTPLAVVTRLSWDDDSDLPATKGRYSIRGMLGLTTTAAIAIVWIKFLTTDRAPQTSLSGVAPQEAMVQWLGQYMPFLIAPLIAATIMLYGLTARWTFAALLFGVAWAVDGWGTTCCAFALEQLTGQHQGGILGDEPMPRWLYVSGRSVTMAGAFVVAAVGGVGPKFGSTGQRNDCVT